MESVHLNVLTGVSAATAGVFMIALCARFKSHVISYRSPLFLVSALLCSLLLVASTSAPLIFTPRAEHLLALYVLHSLFISAYCTRLLLLLAKIKPEWSERLFERVLVFSAFPLLVGGFAVAPGVAAFLLKPGMFAPLAAASAVAACLAALVFCVYVFYEAGRDIFQVKKECLTVLSLALVNWGVVLAASVVPGGFLGARIAAFTWVNFALSVCVFYFAVALPCLLSFRKEDSSILARSRIISERLLENEGAFDEELLSSSECLESILFFKQVNEYVAKGLSDPEQIYDEVSKIYGQFLSDSPSFDITVPSDIKREIERKIACEKGLDDTVFDEAIDYVWRRNIEPVSSREPPTFEKAVRAHAASFFCWK